MIKYEINSGEEVIKGEAMLMLVGTIVGEDEVSCEGETIVVSSDEGVTAQSVLRALARLVAGVIQNGAEDAEEARQMLNYIAASAIGLIDNELLN